MAYVQLNMPGSDLERRAHLLLAQLEDLEPSEAETEGEEPGVATQSLLGGSVKVSTTERLQPPSQEQEQAWGPVGSTPESGIPSCRAGACSLAVGDSLSWKCSGQGSHSGHLISFSPVPSSSAVFEASFTARTSTAADAQPSSDINSSTRARRGPSASAGLQPGGGASS